MCETDTETNPCTVDPSVLELIWALARALQAHHLGYTTIEPLARTYARDRGLIDQAQDFLMSVKGKPQPGCLYPEVFSLSRNEPNEGSLQ